VASNSCSFEFTCSSSRRFSFGNSAMISCALMCENAVFPGGGQTFARLTEIQICGPSGNRLFLKHIDFSLLKKTKLGHYQRSRPPRSFPVAAAGKCKLR
jgi:hypothetical protein